MTDAEDGGISFCPGVNLRSMVVLLRGTYSFACVN